jgi:hypothetical protein
MERRLARYRWFASLGLVAAITATGCARAKPAEPLAQAQLHNDPPAVAAWLRKHARQADRDMAAALAKQGAKDEARGDWSAASKGYGASALYYPDPAMILQYARVQTLSAAKVRAHERRPDLQGADLAGILGLYRSAMAAQGVLGSLTPRQVAETEAAIRCLTSDDMAKLPPGARCDPLQRYQMEYERTRKPGK